MRRLGAFKVYYFYKYNEISDLIATKHRIFGHFVYERLGRICFREFAKNLEINEQIYAVPIDDNVRSGYSHTAILAKLSKSEKITPIFNVLRAQNHVKYAGKSLKFRRENPRKFKVCKQIDRPVILIDDIVTTGLSMLEAKKALEKRGVSVLCGIVLADARD